MSRTDRNPPPNPYGREASWARRLTARLERRRARNLIARNRFDLAGTRQTKPTQGWITW